MSSVDLQLHVTLKTSSFKFKDVIQVIQSDHWGRRGVRLKGFKISKCHVLGWPPQTEICIFANSKHCSVQTSY